MRRRGGLALGFVLALVGRAYAGWVVQTSGTTHDLFGVTAMHNGTLASAWACGAGGTILHTSDGTTWRPQFSGTARTLRAIAFIENTGDVICVGDAGTLLVTADMGGTWVARTTGTTADLRGISDFRHFAVGDSGVVLRSIDAGLTWARVPSGTSSRLNAVAGVFAPIAVGDGGTIVRSTNDGASWTPVASGRQDDLHGVPMFSSMNLVVGDAGLILRSTTQGVAWFAQTSGTGWALRATQFSTGITSRIYCVGDGGTIRKTTDGGETWGRQASGTGADLHAVFFYLNDALGLAVGAGGMILKTTDGGGTVVDVAAAAIPDFAIATAGPNPFHGATMLSVRLPAAATALVRVVDVRGREHARLTHRRFDAGTHRVQWEAGGLASGVYFVELRATGRTTSCRVVLAR
jgi:photosystem II stability/assembly factor-like uncharacterized protein